MRGLYGLINFRLFIAATNSNIAECLCVLTNIHFQDVCNKLLNIMVFCWKNRPSISKFVNTVLTVLMVQIYHDTM